MYMRTSVPKLSRMDGSIVYSPLPVLDQTKALSVPALRLVTSTFLETMNTE